MVDLLCFVLLEILEPVMKFVELPLYFCFQYVSFV